MVPRVAEEADGEEADGVEADGVVEVAGSRSMNLIFFFISRLSS